MPNKNSLRNISIISIAAILCILTLASAQFSTLSKSNSLLTDLSDAMESFFSEAKEESVYLQFDKPFYRPGETIWFSAYLRNTVDHTASDQSDIIHIEWINPKGNLDKSYKLVARNGKAVGDLSLGADQPGGIYKVKAFTNWQKNNARTLIFEKEIQVQKAVLPRLKMKLDFTREAYGPGDMVNATLELQTNDNKVLDLHPFSVRMQVQGNEVYSSSGQTDEKGIAMIEAQLPEKLQSSDGLINVMIDYDGLTESISRSIPIVLNQVEMKFFPEGGYMLSNYENRVGFQAYNEFGKPADVEGIVYDAAGNEVSRLSSYHQGIGALDITPKAGATYHVILTHPKGIEKKYILPESLERGYLIKAVGNKDNVDVIVSTTETESLSLVGQIRGKMYYSETLDANSGLNSVQIDTRAFPAGVMQVTLFDGKGIPRCERLVFVNKQKQLDIEISTDKEKYQPREKVEMTIRVSDERGIPMPGQFSLAVVDDNLLSFADDRSANILSYLLLQQDITGTVHEPSFYFDPNEEKADQALDLLLMTSGWRRYSWEQIQEKELPDHTFQAEKAIVGGVVINGQDRKPLGKATVKVLDRDRSVETDQDGRFSFSGLDLSKETTLEITSPGLNKLVLPVIEYDANLTLELFNYIVPPRGWGMDPQEMAVQADRMQIFKQKGKQIQMEEFVMKDRNMVNAVAIDENKEVPDLQQGNPEMDEVNEADLYDFEKAEVVDARGDVAAQWENGAQNPNIKKSKYYRAKEFAAPVYDLNEEVQSRADFRSTVYWNGDIITGNDGKASLYFYNSDAITSFRATVEGIATDGTIGRGTHVFYTQLPFSVLSKLPVEIVAGDRLSLPVTIRNNTTDVITGKLTVQAPESLSIVGDFPESHRIAPLAAKTVYLDYEVTAPSQDGTLMIAFESEGKRDAIEQNLTVLARGFPARLSFSGQENDEEFIARIENPIEGSITAGLSAYPSVMSELMSGVESILRTPHGCFEQTSSSNYPNIMVLQYLEATEINDPELRQKAQALLEQGYDKLTAFETSGNGYEWFGEDPGHEALTAYGVVQFTDMKKVHESVEQPMIDRTVAWLMDKRDGNGGFKKNPKALDSFGQADEDITNAYIVYSLTEAGIRDIQPELEAAYKNAISSKDPYQLALISAAMFNVKNEQKGNELLKLLLSVQAANGSWTGLKHSITRSTGKSLTVETTSLSVLAMLKGANSDGKSLSKAIDFIIQARSGYGGFGSTQATVLALKALTEFSLFSKRTDEPGVIEVYIDGKKVKRIRYEAGEKDEIIIEGLESHLSEGAHKIKVKFKEAKNPLPYTLNINWSTNLPATSAKCPVSLSTILKENKMRVGETVRLSCKLENQTQDGLPMTIAIIGLPAGLTAQPWQLKELKEKGVVDFYETIGNNLVLYYRQLKPNEVQEINMDLKAEIPGNYEAPASSAYLYYTNEDKYWTSMQEITIVE